jgi:tripartite-type tricarboxylate transporter receptor subunit TctC
VSAASAQDHRVVTIIVPYPAGGIGDILPRAMADVLAQQTGQSFVVDNKPGATQMIGARLAANAKPDGATIFFGSVTSLAINPSVKKELPYDPVRDFEPIALTFVSPQYLITRPGLAPNSMRELVDLARREPAAPQVPAIAESVPGYEATIWFGFLAPAGTPKETVDRLAREMNKAVESGALRERLKAAATEIELVVGTPEQFRAHIQREIPHWRGVIRAANIPLE